MIKLEKFEVVGWEHAIRGMRNAMNSWDKSDSCASTQAVEEGWFDIGPNDHELMMKLRNAGTDHRKFMRMIVVYVDITAPLYWWKEFDAYKVGTVANSCSTMHKIHAKHFTLDDFSHEKLAYPALDQLRHTINTLNVYRDLFVNWDKKDDNSKNALLVGTLYNNGYDKKDAWHQMIQLLPSSYNQKRTVMLNYEVLANIYKSRKNHKLDEWRELCKWIEEELPYPEIITGVSRDVDEGSRTGEVKEE